MANELWSALRAWWRHPLRVTGRLGWLVAEVSWAAVGFLWLRAKGRRSDRMARARQLAHSSRRVLRSLGVAVSMRGAPPAEGLVVCNHLSYLDILVIASCVPATFVSKWEVRRWPVFGWFAREAGTLFVRRDRRQEVTAAGRELAAVLADGVVLVLFPEGTSTGGDRVLPFKSALLEPLVLAQRPVTPAGLRYRLPAGGDPGQEVCYWADMTLAPHLLRLLRHGRIEAELAFAPSRPAGTDRKRLAEQLQLAVATLCGVGGTTPGAAPAGQVGLAGNSRRSCVTL